MGWDFEVIDNPPLLRSTVAGILLPGNLKVFFSVCCGVVLGEFHLAGSRISASKPQCEQRFL
jgi:hypothetical protein